MFEVAEQMMIQLIECMPVLFGVYLIFVFIKDLLFKEWVYLWRMYYCFIVVL